MLNYYKTNIIQRHSESDRFTTSHYKQFYKYFKRKVNKILDVGCNTGRGSAVLKKLNPQLFVVGVDIVSDRVKAALPLIDGGVIALSDKLPIKDNSFDCIVAGEFIEHLRYEDVGRTLEEFFRVLRENGIVMLTTPNPDYLRLKITRRSILSKTHLSQHPSSTLKQNLLKIGYKNIKVFGTGKVSRLIGTHFPFLSVYGSYLIIGEKTNKEGI